MYSLQKSAIEAYRRRSNRDSSNTRWLQRQREDSSWCVHRLGHSIQAWESSGVHLRVVRNDENIIQYAQMRGECPRCHRVCWSSPLYSEEDIGELLLEFSPSAAHQCYAVPYCPHGHRCKGNRCMKWNQCAVHAPAQFAEFVSAQQVEDETPSGQ